MSQLRPTGYMLMLNVMPMTETGTIKMEKVSEACVMQSGMEFCYQIRTCSILLPVLWLHLFFLPVVSSLKILRRFLSYLTIQLISLSVISCSNKSSSRDRIYFSLFSSATFIPLSDNFAPRKPIWKTGTGFLVKSSKTSVTGIILINFLILRCVISQTAPKIAQSIESL